MRIILMLSLSLLLVTFPSTYTVAKANQSPDNMQLTSTLLDVSYISRQPYDNSNVRDTVALQTKILEKINSALFRGAISPQEASDLKERLNKIGTQESWYKSAAIPIPTNIVQDNTNKLAALDKEISKNMSLKFNDNSDRTGGINGDTEVSRLVGVALAKNKITYAQAEQFYSQLAQIQNDYESLKQDSASTSTEFAGLNNKLQSLKGQVQAKLKVRSELTK